MLGIFILIVVNLAIGYALALYLHRQQLLPAGINQSPINTIPLVGNPVANPIAPPPTSEPAPARAKSEQSEPAPATPDAPAAVETEAAPPEAKPAAIPPAPPADATPPIAQASAPVVETQNQANQPIESTATVAEPELAEPAVTQKTPSPAVSDAVSTFQRELNRYRTGLESLDDQMRKHSVAPEAEQVKTCVDQFETLTDIYLEQYRLSQQALSAEATTDLTTASCLAAAELHEAAIATTRAEMTNVAGLADAAAACREFLLATNRLDQASQSFDEELDRTWKELSVAANEASVTNNPVVDSTIAANAPETSTEGLESAILEFIGNLPARTNKFNVALAAVDQLAAINQTHGRQVSDRVMQNIAQTFIALSPHSTLTTDMARQQIMFFQADATIRETTQIVEQVRQRIEAAKFIHNSKPLPVTLSCGVAEATGEDSPGEIVKRLQAMLTEAVRYGSNCTFMQEGEQSAPAIAAPNAKAEKRVIEV
ncbi:MAG TPA: diguanylate cyclase [Pirellulales bacterium]